MLKIRAHHFLCMQGFQGYGYNDEFVKNMGKIIEYINSNKDLKIQLLSSCDDICVPCTNNKIGKCDDSDKVDYMDKKILDKLDLKSGEIFSASELRNLVNQKINTKASAKEICGTCSWHKECTWFSGFRGLSK